MEDYRKPDYWALRAQKEAYPARSVYKLKEIDAKFGLLSAKGPVRVLDLGAAPGSWSLYILRKFSAGNRGRAGPGQRVSLVSVDLAPLSREYDQGLFDKDNFFFIQGDIYAPEVRDSVTSRGPYDLLVSDAAPATTGNRAVDTLRSLELAEAAVDYAGTALRKGGNLVVKVFQGGDTGSLLKRIKAFFQNGKSFKPEACRSGSFETYYLGLGKK